VELYVEEAGAGPPLVLVHGSWTDSRGWANVVPTLAERFRVVCYDRRGHGRSPSPPGQGSILEDVTDCAALIERLDLAPAAVAASSWGGLVALRLAASRPELVARVFAHEPPAFGLLEGDGEWEADFAGIVAALARVERLLESGRMVKGARTFVDEVAFEPGAWERLPERVRAAFVANAETYLDELRDPDQLTVDLDSLAAFPGPALVTTGGRSAPLYVPVADRIAAALPAGRRGRFEDAGHVPHLTHLDEYVAVVTAFLA
jgi:pimeloyl-ACP methyl ester carboxylesterase